MAGDRRRRGRLIIRCIWLLYQRIEVHWSPDAVLPGGPTFVPQPSGFTDRCLMTQAFLAYVRLDPNWPGLHGKQGLWRAGL
jgi:hypothetical protein